MAGNKNSKLLEKPNGRKPSAVRGSFHEKAEASQSESSMSGDRSQQSNGCGKRRLKGKEDR